MGKRGNEIRAQVKRLARGLGFKETELGELKATQSKAEARKRFLSRKWHLSFMVVEGIREIQAFYEANKLAIQGDIVAAMSRRISDDIDYALFDAEVLSGLSASIPV